MDLKVNHLQLPIPRSYIEALIELLQIQGVPPHKWIPTHHLEILTHEKSTVWFNPEDFQALLLSANLNWGKPHLGFYLGERLGLGTHGLVGQTLSQSKNLEEALQTLERFSILQFPLIQFSILHSPKRIELHFQVVFPKGDASRIIIDAAVVSLKNLFQDLSSQGGLGIEVHFQSELKIPRSLIKELIASPIHFDDSWEGLSFDATEARSSLRMADSNAFSAGSSLCKKQLENLSATLSYSNQVRRQLWMRPGRFPSLKGISRLLNIHSRTLHRRLLDEGTSYRCLLEEVRLEFAKSYLQKSSLSTEETAHALGYSDVSNFRRALIRMTGSSPRKLRGKPKIRRELNTRVK